jgi:hypothetical protein
VKTDEEDLPCYLLSARMEPRERDMVHLKIRLSMAPEETTKTNALTAEKFREIFVTLFKFTPEQVEEFLGKMRMGDGFTCQLDMQEEALYRSGLLGGTPD